jgi:hypothetical protein
MLHGYTARCGARHQGKGEMTTLERISRERCKWCAASKKGMNPGVGNGPWYHLIDDDGENWQKCTAPTPEVLIEEQASFIV